MVASTASERLNEVACLLLPGDGASPSAKDVHGLEELIAQALVAIGPEVEVVQRGLRVLPIHLTWESLREFSEKHPVEFEVIATVVSGAYFMSVDVLDSIGYPHGPRKAPRNDLVADELGSGLLDPVLDRGSILREAP